jgi:hypothetical protein
MICYDNPSLIHFLFFLISIKILMALQKLLNYKIILFLEIFILIVLVN